MLLLTLRQVKLQCDHVSLDHTLFSRVVTLWQVSLLAKLSLPLQTPQRQLRLLTMKVITPFECLTVRLGATTTKRLSRKFPGIAVDVTKFQYTYYSVRCVHYGHSRQRGKGLRPNQRAFSLRCEAIITLSYNKFQDKLVVREVNLEHNHRVGQK